MFFPLNITHSFRFVLKMLYSIERKEIKYFVVDATLFIFYCIFIFLITGLLIFCINAVRPCVSFRLSSYCISNLQLDSAATGPPKKETCMDWIIQSYLQNNLARQK